MGSSSFWIVHRMAQASMPGDDLLFHCLSSSTIGAVGFHGRVRDGIGWDTDAMVTRQWSLCAWADNLWDGSSIDAHLLAGYSSYPLSPLSGHQQR